MNFEMNEKQLQIVKTAKEFAEAYLAPTVLERDEKSEYPMEAYKKLGELGLVGLPYSSEYGGSDCGYQEYALAVEEISKVEGAMGISYSVTTSLYGGPVNNFGTEEQKKEFLPPVLSGSTLGAFGLTEPNAGSDAAGVVTVAENKGDHYVVNGLKCFSTNGPLAGYYFFVASTNPELKTKGLTAFVTKTDVEGLSVGKIENKMGIRPAQVSEMIFKDVIVPVENRLGKEGEGFKIAMNTLDGGRIGVAAQGLGIAEGASARLLRLLLPLDKVSPVASLHLCYICSLRSNLEESGYRTRIFSYTLSFHLIFSDFLSALGIGEAWTPSTSSTTSSSCPSSRRP